MNDIITRLIDVPTELKGVVKEDPDGDYNIYINARLSEPEQVAAFLHEMRHIEYGHLHDDTKTLEQIEREASL